MLNTLDFFTENRPPKLDLSGYSLPFVVGSGNAYHTGAILFSGQAAVLADESDFRSLIEAYYNDYGPRVSGKNDPFGIIVSSN